VNTSDYRPVALMISHRSKKEAHAQREKDREYSETKTKKTTQLTST